jgi:hypothetical protein
MLACKQCNDGVRATDIRSSLLASVNFNVHWLLHRLRVDAGEANSTVTPESHSRGWEQQTKNTANTYRIKQRARRWQPLATSHLSLANMCNDCIGLQSLMDANATHDAILAWSAGRLILAIVHDCDETISKRLINFVSSKTFQRSKNRSKVECNWASIENHDIS